MISKKKAQEETDKNQQIRPGEVKKKSFELKKVFFSFFSALKSPREPPQGVGGRGGWLRLAVCKY